jgi:hypothetical protein
MFSIFSFLGLHGRTRPGRAVAGPSSGPAVDVAQALDEAKRTLRGLDAEGFSSRQSLAFAESLLASLGENPQTPQNRLLAHQMAIENLRSRDAILGIVRR